MRPGSPAERSSRRARSPPETPCSPATRPIRLCPTSRRDHGSVGWPGNRPGRGGRRRRCSPSRLLGWVRTSVFLAEFGGTTDGPICDAFWAAFGIPDTLFQLVAAGAVGSALVPVASALLANGEEERARRLVATIANLILMALVPLAVVVWFAAPAIMPVIAAHPRPEQLALEIELTRLDVALADPPCIAAAMTAGLNATGIFGIPALAPNVYNAVIIVCAHRADALDGHPGPCIRRGAGRGRPCATQAYAVRNAADSTGLVLDTPRPRREGTLKLMAPRALGLGVTQIVFLVNSFFAVQLTSGRRCPGHRHLHLRLHRAANPSRADRRAAGDRAATAAFPGDCPRRHRELPASGGSVAASAPLRGHPAHRLMLVLAAPRWPSLPARRLHAPRRPSTSPVFLVFLFGPRRACPHLAPGADLLRGQGHQDAGDCGPPGRRCGRGRGDALFPSFELTAWRSRSASGRGRRFRCSSTSCGTGIGFDLRPLGLTVAFAVPGASLTAAAASRRSVRQQPDARRRRRSQPSSLSSGWPASPERESTSRGAACCGYPS